VSTTSHDSLCAWLKPVVEFAELALGEDVTPLLVFDRGGAFPEMMSELRDGGAEFVTYERKPNPALGATEFKERRVRAAMDWRVRLELRGIELALAATDVSLKEGRSGRHR